MSLSANLAIPALSWPLALLAPGPFLALAEALLVLLCQDSTYSMPSLAIALLAPLVAHLALLSVPLDTLVPCPLSARTPLGLLLVDAPLFLFARTFLPKKVLTLVAAHLDFLMEPLASLAASQDGLEMLQLFVWELGGR